VTSTADVFPQIQPITPVNKMIEENEDRDITLSDPRNSLKAGGMLSAPRGRPKISFPGPGFTGYFPPDCDMGVGPNHVVTVVNIRIAFYSKSGTKTFEQTMDENGFWNGVGGASEVYSDPKVYYDAVSQRWFVYMIEVNGLGSGTHKSRVLLAVSDDNNPNGNWFKYSLDALITVGGNELWMDYPTVGMNKDGIAIGGNMFGFSAGGGVVQLMTVPKAPLLTGASGTVTSFQDATGGFTIQPARSWDNTNSRLYCLGRGNGGTIRVFAVNNLTSSPTLVQTTVTVPNYDFPNGSPAAGGGTLDTLDGRLFNCWFRAGKMVAAHTVRTVNNPTNHVRWYQFAVNNWPASGQPTLLQSGEINPAGTTHTHMPAIAMNSFGDISVIYSRSSSAIAADLVMSSRTTGDPSGTIGAPVLLKSSIGAYNAGRWGDYFSCVVDATDDFTFWGFGMEILNGAWQTSVHSCRSAPAARTEPRSR